MRYRQRIMIGILSFTLICINLETLTGYAKENNSSTKVNEIMQIIQTYHLSNASEEDLMDAAIQGMVDSLNDPYTEYLTIEEHAAFLKAISGGYLGIGINLALDDNGVYITEVKNGSPAAQIGLRKGDYLQKVNGIIVKSDKYEDVFNDALSGKVAGDKLSFSIIRAGVVKKYEIPLKQLDTPIIRSIFLPEGVGYIALSAFSVDADKKFTVALDDLKNKGMKSLIIDLRYNGGGYIETAKAIAAHFLKDQLLMTTRNKDGKESSVMVTGETKAEYPIVVLVNEYSASASEVFAGAMQDYKLATIVGVNTYGKGVTQHIMPVFNGGALKITTEEYFTPNHHPVNHNGIKPDIEARGAVEQMIEAYWVAGAKKIELELTKNDYKLNQSLFAGYGVEAFIVNGKDIYLPVRLLMAIMDGRVTWDNTKKTILLTQKNISETLAANSKHLIMRDGINYLSTSYMKSKFPKFNWSFKNEAVFLEASH